MKYPKLTPLALALLPALHGLPLTAMADTSVTVFGVLDIGLVHQNEPDIGIPVLAGTTLAQLSLPAPFSEGAGMGSALGGNGVEGKGLHVAQGARSRLGIRGTEDLGNGLSVRFDLEHRFYPDTGGTSKTDPFWDRATVGLTSTQWGELTLGRDYMPGFYTQYVLDPWSNEGVAQMGANLYAFSGYLNEITRYARYNNGVYHRIKLGGFSSVVGFSLKEDQGVSPTLSFGTRWGFSTMYNSGPWFLGLSYDTSEVLQSGAKEFMWQAGASYDAGFIKPRLSVGGASLKAVGTFNALGGPLGMNKRNLRPSSWALAATIPYGPGFFKLGHTQLDWDDASATHAETHQRKSSAGYEYTLSKRTAIYMDVSQGKTATLPTVRAWDLGLRHKF